MGKTCTGHTVVRKRLQQEKLLDIQQTNKTKLNLMQQEQRSRGKVSLLQMLADSERKISHCPFLIESRHHD